MAEELNRETEETIGDRTDPEVMRELLCNFFERKIYTIEHKKYKTLLRWAHFALVIIIDYFMTFVL
jgi:hypothetical protein